MIYVKIGGDSMDLSFLKSNRFWVMVLGAAVIYLQSKGWIGEAEMKLFATLAAGFVTIRTVDRATEQLAGTAKG